MNGKNENGIPADDTSALIKLLQQTRIFGGLDYAACATLLPTLERVSLAQGDILFSQGDVSDSLYILTSGQLTAWLATSEGKNKVVGTIEKGETVGEMGAFSHQPRSLTVRAAIDSQLLKFTHEQFKIFCQEQPNFITSIIDLVIERSQNTLKLISEKKIHRHIALIKANDDVPMEKFISKIKQNFTDDEHYFFLDKLPEKLTLSHFLTRAENNNSIVVFALDEKSFEGLGAKINSIGGIFVVADGDKPPAFSEFVVKMLSRHQTPFATQYDLVLLHDDKVSMPSGTAQWLAVAEFTLHHHLHLSADQDYQRLLRFIYGKPIGLVLGGGGHKGWATLGAVKALLDAGIPIDAVGGTSVGSLIGACYALHLNYEKTRDAYKILAQAASKPFSLKNLTWPLISLINARAPTESLWEVFDEVNVEDLWIPYFSVSCNLTTGTEAVHRYGLLWEKLRASAAIPGIAPPMLLSGDMHYDGGLLNNLPVDHMQQLLGGEGLTIAVSLVGMGLDKKSRAYSFPPVVPFWMALMKKLHLGYQEYVFPPFFHTFMRALLVGSSTKEKNNQLLADLMICPDVRTYHVLKYDAKLVEDMIRSGYDAANEQIAKAKIFQIDSTK